MKHLSLSQQFVVVSLIVLLANMAFIGRWVGGQIETSVTDRTAATTALFVDSFVSPEVQELAWQETLSSDQFEALDRRFRDTAFGSEIVAFNIWDPSGRIAYSTNSESVGRQFPMQEKLARAWEGYVVTGISDLDEPEHTLAPEGTLELIETYSPIRAAGTNRVIAVAEFYQTVDDLRRDIVTAQTRSWLIVASATLITYLLLAGIVDRGSRMIRRQQTDLREKIDELSRVLDQNEHLHERVRRAATRATELNERFLRRIGAEMHDGPAQDIGLALLKLDDVVAGFERVPEVGLESKKIGSALTTTRESLERALQDLRAIATGLRLPELEALSLSESVRRVVRLHERRTESSAILRIRDLPEQAPLPVKITVYRLVQEALNNAFRHGGGVGQAVEVTGQTDQLRVEIVDSGPGFKTDPLEARPGHLGLPGMRERVESLGGMFKIRTQPGEGTRIVATVPLVPEEETES